MSQDHGAPGENIVEIDVAVDVVQLGSLGAFDESGLPSDRAERPNGAIDASGDELLRRGKELG
jgi:hypothetical protein